VVLLPPVPVLLPPLPPVPVVLLPPVPLVVLPVVVELLLVVLELPLDPQAAPRPAAATIPAVVHHHLLELIVDLLWLRRAHPPSRRLHRAPRDGFITLRAGLDGLA
jgi:hypothetical protein